MRHYCVICKDSASPDRVYCDRCFDAIATAVVFPENLTCSQIAHIKALSKAPR